MTMSPEASMELFNPFLPEYLSDPYPTYRRLRATDPVHRSFLGLWVVSKYDDCVAVFRNPKFGVDIDSYLRRDSRTLRAEDPDKSPLDRVLTSAMLWSNPPEHTKRRSETAKACSPHMSKYSHGYTEQIVNELLDALPTRGRVDLVQEVIARLPVAFVSRLMGLPREHETKLRQFSDELARSFDPFRSQSFYRRVNQIVVEFEDFLRVHIRERRQDPTDDMLTSMIQRSDQPGGVNQAELMANCILMFIAGSQTTITLIAGGFLALLKNPDQMQRLRSEPQWIPSAVEEMARYDGPIGMLTRIASEDIQVGGKLIRRGEQVTLLPQSANHDPDIFTAPGTFDVCRQPNPHIAFGAGIHHCLGAAAARMEAQTAIRIILERLPDIRLEPESVRWRDTRAIRGIDSYYVQLG